MSVAIRAFNKWQNGPRVVSDPAQVQAVIQVGRKAQMLVDHPGWQMYLDHVEALRAETQRKRDAIVAEIVDGDKLGDELAKLKLACDSLKGELAGLSKAIDLVPELIKRASDAVVLMEQTGAQSPDAGE